MDAGYDYAGVAVRNPPLEQVKLTPAQSQLWDETRTALSIGVTPLTYVFYALMTPVRGERMAVFTLSVPVAATDGRVLILNPETFFKYTLQERLFIICHEILHAVWAHCDFLYGWMQKGYVPYSDGAHIPFNQDLMNIAMDAVINDILVTSQYGTMPADAVHNQSMAKGTDAVVDVYRRLYNAAPKKGGGQGKGGKGKGKGGKESSGELDPDGKAPLSGKAFDKLLEPGAAEGEQAEKAMVERDQREWSAALQAGLEAARLQGTLPAGMARLLDELKEPTVPWQDHIRAIIARRVGRDAYDWGKLDRRLIVRGIGSPGRRGFGAECVVVGIDTSGSIGQSELTTFFSEMGGILDDVRPRELHVVWCDAQVNRVDLLEDGQELEQLRAKKAPGGGGTDFRPVFNWIEKNHLNPDALVYLTDSYGTFPDAAPPYPVIWGSIVENGKYPWGDVVNVTVRSK